MKLSSDTRTVLATRLISNWKNKKKQVISLDVGNFNSLFPFLTVLHTVTDQNNKIIFVLVDRVKAIEQSIKEYGLDG